MAGPKVWHRKVYKRMVWWHVGSVRPWEYGNLKKIALEKANVKTKMGKNGQKELQPPKKLGGGKKKVIIPMRGNNYYRNIMGNYK